MATAEVRVNSVSRLFFIFSNKVEGVILLGLSGAECTNGSVCLHGLRDLSLCFNPNGGLMIVCCNYTSL